MRIGRPKIAVRQRKSKIAGVRLDNSERKLLEKAAKLKRSKLSFWMRQTLLTSAMKETGCTIEKPA